MGITEGGLVEIERKKKTVDQSILDPNIFIKDFPLEPWTPYLVTNRFVQQGISRCLAFSETESKWVRMKVDSEGRLITTAEVAAPTVVILQGRKYGEFVVADAVSVAAGGTLTHTGVDVNDYAKKTVLVSTTANCTVYVQVSDDNTNFYNIKTAADGDLSWNCNNEKIAIQIDHYAHYMRIVIYATVASTVTGIIMCQV